MIEIIFKFSLQYNYKLPFKGFSKKLNKMFKINLKVLQVYSIKLILQYCS